MTGHRHAVQVVFIHGPAASGKHTIGLQLSRLTGLPLFHNHLAVDAALSLFRFGTQGFKNVRSAVWRTAFQEAARLTPDRTSLRMVNLQVGVVKGDQGNYDESFIL